MPPSLRLEGSASYRGRAVFRPLSLEIGSAQWTCLLGPSGVGKTTILRLIAGLEDECEFDGRIDASDGQPLPGRVAYMAQTDLLFPWLDVLGNTLLGARLRRERSDTSRAEALIERVGLADHIAKRPHQLSGGMRQRAALARTLMEDRPVILLDEPFSALDARTRVEMQDLAAELLADRTVLLVTHDPAEAARLGHRIHLMLADGLREVAPPPIAPIRAYDDPTVFACQSELMALLRAPDAHAGAVR
ncbi:MAG: ABC transporter ATP-binding protein [Pseudomonadota bacterium]